jgi:hypothetical protein
MGTETAPPAADVIDSTATEMPPETGAPAPPPPDASPPPAVGTDLVPAGTATMVIASDDPREILAKAQQIAAPLADLVKQAGLAKNLGGSRPHVEVGGWQAAGAMLGTLGGQALHAETVWSRVVRDPGTGEPMKQHTTITRTKNGQTTVREFTGYDWEACVEVRTPAGIVVGRAEAMCGRDESKWSSSDNYAVKSMAETRAESRAYRRAIGWVMHMAGYNATPAEEMPDRAPSPVEIPVWAGPVSDDGRRELIAALVGPLGMSGPAAADLVGRVTKATGGPIPRIVLAVVKAMAVGGVPAPETPAQGTQTPPAPDPSPPAAADASPTTAPPEDPEPTPAEENAALEAAGQGTFNPLTQQMEPPATPAATPAAAAPTGADVSALPPLIPGADVGERYKQWPSPQKLIADGRAAGFDLSARSKMATFLREHGCTCPDPLAATGPMDDGCPFHGIPF